MTNTLNTINLNTYAPVTTNLVGKIEYLHRGEVFDHTDYEDAETLIQDIMDELQWDVPIAVTLYCDDDGNLPVNLEEIECLIQEVKIEDPVKVVRI
jgi:hypothetical protein